MNKSLRSLFCITIDMLVLLCILLTCGAIDWIVNGMTWNKASFYFFLFNLAVVSVSVSFFMEYQFKLTLLIGKENRVMVTHRCSEQLGSVFMAFFTNGMFAFVLIDDFPPLIGCVVTFSAVSVTGFQLIAILKFFKILPWEVLLTAFDRRDYRAIAAGIGILGDINSTVRLYGNPLLMSMRRESADLIVYLLEKGADPLAIVDGVTVIDSARQYGYPVSYGVMRDWTKAKQEMLVLEGLIDSGEACDEMAF